MSQNLQAELDAILHGAALASLDDRAFLRVTGSDATRWLNGMVTNSIQALGPGEGCYNFLLNAQGRILGDCTIFREPTGDQPVFILATSKDQIDAIQKHLDHFIIMDDVELQPVSDRAVLLTIGPDSPKLLDATDMSSEELEPGEWAHVKWTTFALDFDLLRSKDTRTPQYEIWAHENTTKTLHGLLHDAGAIEVSPAALEALRLLEARPLYGRDITEKYLPQETNQPQALHFNKGCYLGQEIVERIRSRGQVHRLLTPLTLTGELPSQFPAPIEAAALSPGEPAKPVGEITSAALVPLAEGDQILALGYVRREALDTHALLTYAGGTVAPRSAAQVQTVTGASK